MLREQRAVISVMVLFALSFIFTLQSAMGDGITFVYRRGSPVIESRVETGVMYHSQRGDKITSEKRDGDQVDDWMERGASSVTDSPKYKEGVRLATWATQDDDEYDFGLASAIYQFQIPDMARSIKIKIHYDGEPGRYSMDDEIAGRIWIKSKYPSDRYNSRYSGERKSYDEALYGDTFVLRKNKDDAEIKISAREHVIDGTMELHVIAEGGQRLDVDYIKVETYRSIPEIRVITREYRDYVPKPWYRHTYSYFYAGPVFHFDGGRYVIYTYPRNHNMIEIRARYGNYLREYHNRHPQISINWSGIFNSPKFEVGVRHGIPIGKWTPGHEKVRKTYTEVYRGKRSPVETRAFREQVQNITREHRKPSDDRNERGRNNEKDDDDREYKRGRDRGR